MAWFRSRRDEILACLKAVSEVKRAATKIHLLGVTRVEHIPRFSKLGVVSFDSTSPLRQAFKDEKDNYYTLDRTYRAIRVPQVDGNPRLRQLIVSGKVDQRQAMRLETECLDRLLAYGEHKAASRRRSRRSRTTKGCTRAPLRGEVLTARCSRTDPGRNVPARSARGSASTSSSSGGPSGTGGAAFTTFMCSTGDYTGR